jgi:hypothetical protein
MPTRFDRLTTSGTRMPVVVSLSKGERRPSRWPARGNGVTQVLLNAVRKVMRYSRLFRREEGQATFEFVLILPFFILFLLLLVDFGIMMYEYVSVSNAVREGARYGAVNCGDGACTAAEVCARVVDRSGGILSDSECDTPAVTVGWPDGSDRGDSVVVKVTHPYHFLFFPASIDVVSCADMRLEQTDKTSGLPSGSGCGG